MTSITDLPSDWVSANTEFVDWTKLSNVQEIPTDPHSRAENGGRKESASPVADVADIKID